MRTNILVYGAGLDSLAYAVALQDAGIPFIAVHYNYGQVAAIAEADSTQHVFENTQFFTKCVKTYVLEDIKRYPILGKGQLISGNRDESPFILGRNLCFIMATIKKFSQEMLAHGLNIILGFTDPGYEPMSDATAAFLDSVNVVLQQSYDDRVRVVAPLIHSNRDDVIAYAYDKYPTIFVDSMTCWTPSNGERCGLCKHCQLQSDLTYRIMTGELTCTHSDYSEIMASHLS